MTVCGCHAWLGRGEVIRGEEWMETNDRRDEERIVGVSKEEESSE